MREALAIDLQPFDSAALPAAKDEDWRQFPLQKWLKKAGLEGVSSSAHIGADIEPSDKPLFEGRQIEQSLADFVREQSDHFAVFDVRKDAVLQIEPGLEAGQVSAPHIQIRVAKNVSLTLYEVLEAYEAGWLCPLIEIVLEEGAKLHFERLDQVAGQTLLTEQMIVTLKADAQATFFNAKSGDAKSRLAVHIFCEGEGAHADVTGLCLADQQAVGETLIDICHNVAHSTSHQLYHAIVGGKAQSTYTGKVTVAAEAQKTDAQQLSRGLLLSPMATNFVKPELEIYADDVQCAHGATTGDLDEQALFYMRSRGLSENEAKILLIQAFCEAPLSALQEDSPLRETLESALDAKLKEVLR